MEHTKSKVIVYQTSEYNRFKKVEGNRSINNKKIDRIIAEIQAGNDVLDHHPVLVKEGKNALEVLDGQHRIEVAKKLKRPVHYVIKKESMNLYQVAKVNSNVEKWTAQDFIKCYVAAGNENYKKIDKFQRQYKIAIGVCLSMLDHGGLKADFSAAAELVREFETGVYVVKKYKEAVMLAEICKSFEDFSNWNSRSFIVAISKIINAGKCDMDVLLKKYKEDPRRLESHGNWKKYLVNLEEIYNTGYSKRRTIY